MKFYSLLISRLKLETPLKHVLKKADRRINLENGNNLGYFEIYKSFYVTNKKNNSEINF